MVFPSFDRERSGCVSEVRSPGNEISHGASVDATASPMDGCIAVGGLAIQLWSDRCVFLREGQSRALRFRPSSLLSPRRANNAPAGTLGATANCVVTDRPPRRTRAARDRN